MTSCFSMNKLMTTMMGNKRRRKMTFTPRMLMQRGISMR